MAAGREDKEGLVHRWGRDPRNTTHTTPHCLSLLQLFRAICRRALPHLWVQVVGRVFGYEVLHMALRGNRLVRRGIAPRVALDLGNGVALHRVETEHAGQQIAYAVREVLGHLEAAAGDLSVERGIVRSGEWKPPTEQRVQKHAEAPNVDGRAEVFAAQDDLGSHVGGRSAKHFQPLMVRAHTEAKIDELRVASPIEQDVFELDVSVRDVHAVQIGHLSGRYKAQGTW